MNGRRPKFIIVVALLAVVPIALAGCKKSEPEPQSPPTSMTPQASAPDVKEATLAAADSIEQTTCPIMGNPIDKDVFVEYQGKKVYFCCPDCVEKFKADPEKYVAALPQFKK